MWKWFKRKNAQAEVDKDKGTTKINASDVAVEVDGRKINIADLEKAMIDKENEDAETAKKAELEKELEPISMEENFVASNGKEYKIGDLVANWKKRNEANDEEGTDKEFADKKAAEYKKAMADADAKENASTEATEKLEPIAKRMFGKPYAELSKEERAEVNAEASGADNSKAEEEKKNAADAEAKAKADAEAKDKEDAEKKENSKKAGKAFFKELHNANHASESPLVSVGRSRAERASEWAKRNRKK